MKSIGASLSILFIGLFLFAARPACAACPSLDLNSFTLTAAPESACYSFSFESKSLSRKIPVNVILPKGYQGGKSGVALPYAIFLHGRGGDREQIVDLGGVNAMKALEKKGGKGFLIFAPSGGDHYWANAAVSGEKWGDMVVEDLVAEIEQQFQVARNSPAKRALFGISMGGAGTLQLAFHHPKKFETVMCDSPVFRREEDIWKPGSTIDEPHDDYDSFGAGESYRERSPRALCERAKRADGTCIPAKNFRLDIGERDGMLDRYPDTRKFIVQLKAMHPKFSIGIEHCRDKNSTAQNPDRDAHSYVYWRCQLPKYLSWLSQQIN